MNIIRVSRNITIIALLLSLLFHMSTIIYVFMQKTSNPLSSHIKQQEQTEELKNLTTHDPWVETKARSGNFGSPVFFRDEPEIQQPLLQHEQQQTEQESFGTQENSSEIATPEQTSSYAEASVDSSINESNESSEKPLEKSETSFQNSIQSQPAVATKKTAARKKVVRPRKTLRSNQNTFAQTAGPKPPLSLAQLTQGFLHHLEEGGTYGVSMIGKKNGIPSENQLKYERYLQKLGWCLQNSYNINNYRCPAVSQDTIAHIHLVLNRDGTIRHLNVAKSSGNMHLDQFTLFVFRDAGSSFPPVPQYLPDDPFAITYVISIGTTENMKIYRR